MTLTIKVLENYLINSYNNGITEGKTLQQKKKEIKAQFYAEYGALLTLARVRNKNGDKVFYDYIQGLPTFFNHEYTNYNILELLRNEFNMSIKNDDEEYKYINLYWLKLGKALRNIVLK